MEDPFYRPGALRVRADFIGDDGVWDDDPDHPGPATLDGLGVRADLAERLRAWTAEYQRIALTDFEFPTPEDERRWTQAGLHLAYELQNEVPDIETSYDHDDDPRPVRERRGP